jgi:hypothetical protein
VKARHGSILTVVTAVNQFQPPYPSSCTVPGTKISAFSELQQIRLYGIRISGIKLGMMCKYSIGNFSLQNSSDPILRGVFEKLVKPDYDNLPKNDQEGLRRICANWNYAFVISPFFVRQSYGDYQCTLVEVPHASFQTSVSIIMNKDSNYKRLFTQR